MQKIDHITEALPLLSAWSEVHLVCDRNVAAAAEPLRPACRAVRLLEAGEAGKTMDTVLDICRWLLDAGADRDALLLAVGGGITTDICGFAASIYKRGIRFGYIPTTLLAQVDAAIGGKTGVNLDGYKNMIGLIREPEFTLLCPELLQTLPAREWRGGLAELLKTFLIDNSGGWYEKALKEVTGEAILAAASVKERIVAADLYERGERRKLNLGHTFAHAIERQSRLVGTDISHGEAVAMGILLSARVSERMGLAGPGLEERLRSDFKSVGLPVDCPFPPQALSGDMTRDKKASGDQVIFVLIRSIGDVVTVPLRVGEVIEML